MTVDLHAKALTQSPVNANARGGGKEDKKPGQVTVDSGEGRREFFIPSNSQCHHHSAI